MSLCRQGSNSYLLISRYLLAQAQVPACAGTSFAGTSLAGEISVLTTPHPHPYHGFGNASALR